MAITTRLFKTEEGGQHLVAGATIFEVGDAADNLYIVQEGRVDITVGGQVVETVGPGGIFGEMAMIDGTSRSASAVVAEDSRVLPIDKRRFDFLISETPNFARTVLALLAERLRAANRACT